ncbi:MAG: hypothetical protein AAF497_07765, partial [Planctomycetota bacterium]
WRLTLRLPDKEIDLRLIRQSGSVTQTWSGETPEQVNEFLLRHVPSEKVSIAIFGSTPGTDEHVRLKIRTAKKNAREFKIAMTVFGSLAAATLLWMAADQGILKAGLMILGLCFYPGSVIFFIARSLKQRVRESEQLLEQSSMKDSRLANQP